MVESKTLRVRKKVRPMRFLFLVPPNDLNAIKEVIKINTALWGGFYNPIESIEQDNDSIASFFKASHSDVIINCSSETILATPLNLGHYQIIQQYGYNGLLYEKDEKYSFRYGCDIRPLIEFYWKEEGRFQNSFFTHEKDSVPVYVEGENSHWSDYSLLQFGHYPENHTYNYKKGYQKATNCKTLQLDDKSVANVLNNELRTPLLFTLAKTKHFYRDAHSRFFNEEIIYIGDINKAQDWMEFWNIRCFYSKATFIHQEDIPLFENKIRSIVTKKKTKQDNQKYLDAMIQKSSSLSSDLFSKSIKQIKNIVSERFWISNNIRPFGIGYKTRKGRVHGPLPIEAPIAEVHEQEDLEYLSDGKLEIKVPVPDFLTPYMNQWERSWCTTVTSWGDQQSNFWVKIPDIGDVEKDLRKNFFSLEGFRISLRENIVLFPTGHHLDIATLNLPKHFDILRSIFSGYGIEILDYSDKGRFAMAIEKQAAHGIWRGANILLDKGVQAVLYKLAEKNGRKHLPRFELEKIIGENSASVKEQKVPSGRLVDILIERTILRLGIELKCNYCYRQGWYHISQLGETFKCSFCFTEQNLPIIDKKKWRYRSSGLFSSKHVGYGSLPVISVKMFFQNRYHFYVKTFFSFNIKYKSGKLGEIDLAFVRHEMQEEPELLVCECKSGEASQEDFDKLEKICATIPKTVACMATWKEEFSQNEKDFAQKFWNKGYEIVLLTRLDIEADEMSLEGVDARYKHIHDFVDLAHATRQKHLGSIDTESLPTKYNPHASPDS